MLYKSGNLPITVSTMFEQVWLSCTVLAKASSQCILETDKPCLNQGNESQEVRNSTLAPNQLTESGSELQSSLPVCLQLISLLATWQHTLKKKSVFNGFGPSPGRLGSANMRIVSYTSSPFYNSAFPFALQQMVFFFPFQSWTLICMQLVDFTPWQSWFLLPEIQTSLQNWSLVVRLSLTLFSSDSNLILQNQPNHTQEHIMGNLGKSNHGGSIGMMYTRLQDCQTLELCLKRK